MYESIAKLLQTDDIYKDAKSKATKEAKKLIPKCEDIIKNSDDKLLSAGKIAIAGNVIDLATTKSFSLEDEIENISKASLSIDDFEVLNNRLAKASTIVYFADNAGEHIFDKLYIHTIKSHFPKLKIYYFTRGNPIINDVTYEEAIEDGLDEVCEVINSGVRTPCIIFKDLNSKAYDIISKLENNDFIISKGMGNYECLNEEFSKDIFFLLKVKCEVVASSLGLKLGDLVCKLNNK
jgi:uncharacterized protein with ATP-grasp and redox domains